MYDHIARLPRRLKILMMLVADLILIPFALWSAIGLRLGSFDFSIQEFWWMFLVLPVLTVPVFVKLGLYRAVIRYFDEKILFSIVTGVIFSTFVITSIIVMTRVQGIPRSSILIYSVISSVYILLSRYLARGIIRNFERNNRRKEKVAIYGAGRAGMQTVLSMRQSNDYHPAIFFDDNPELQGTTVAGIRVYSPSRALEIMQQFDCYQLLIAIPSASLGQRRRIVQAFENKGIRLKIIPGMSAILDGNIKIEDIREIGIEDLLGRDPVPPDEALIGQVILGRTILVTGGGGSIGSEICRQVVLRKPKKLVVVESSEFSLYSIQRELSGLGGQFEVVPVLGDVSSEGFLDSVFKLHSVEVVFHAAAYKHVPLVEQNIVVGVKNNVFGTLNVLRACELFGVKSFTLISTDKAVRPTNVMGASKRIAELCVQHYSKKKLNTIFSMVRFGNVLGSSGSVIPLFKEQIKAGGPITVTHPDITRYFMTIPEACELVLQATSLAKGGDVFVLDMGEPVKILDLAKKMIQLSGYRYKSPNDENGDIAIDFIGLRPGEKLFEELLIGENVFPTGHQRIMRAMEKDINEEDFLIYLKQLSQSIICDDSRSLLKIIEKMVPEFKHDAVN